MSPPVTHDNSLAVILPLLNEEEILWDTARGVALCLDQVVGKNRWCFVPVDNGSSDGTPHIIHELHRRWPLTVPLHLNQRNIGMAMRAGLWATNSEWAYLLPLDEFDADFLRWSWQHRDHYDLLLGSKRADPTLNQQTSYRRLLSWGLNSLLELSCGSVLADTHGQKLVRLGVARAVSQECRLSRGIFDTELSLRIWKKGLRVVEIPVRYSERRPSRDPMLRKVGRNLVDLVRLWRLLSRVPFTGAPDYRRVSHLDVLASPNRGTAGE